MEEHVYSRKTLNDLVLALRGLYISTGDYISLQSYNNIIT